MSVREMLRDLPMEAALRDYAYDEYFVLHWTNKKELMLYSERLYCMQLQLEIDSEMVRSAAI